MMKDTNKKYILPDYTKKIDKIFLVSPFVRGEKFFNEFANLLELIISLKKGEIVLVSSSEEDKKKLENSLQEFFKMKNELYMLNFINYYIVRVLDVWIRDYFSCGNVLYNNKILGIKGIYAPSYNSYSPYIDDAAGIKLMTNYYEDYITLPIKLDGGNLICNDEYIICSEKIYTENYNFSKKEIDEYFEKNFKQKLIVLPCEILDVIGHVDSIMRFLTPRLIVLSIYDSEYKADNRYVSKIREILLQKLGLDYEIIFLPSALSDDINDDNIFSAKGLFINFLRLDDCIIFPSFEGLEDYNREISEILRKKTDNLNIYFSPCDKYSFEGGCFNCITNVKFNCSVDEI